LKKSSTLIVGDRSERTAARWLLMLKRVRAWRQDQLSQFRRFWSVAARRNSSRAQKGASQPEAIEAQEALQVRERISIFSGHGATYVGLGLRDVAGKSRACSWIDAGPCGAGISRTTPRPSVASIAVIFAGAIVQCCPVIHPSPGGRQHLGRLDRRRADRVRIVGKVFAGERPIVASDLSNTGNVAARSSAR